MSATPAPTEPSAKDVPPEWAAAQADALLRYLSGRDDVYQHPIPPRKDQS